MVCSVALCWHTGQDNSTNSCHLAIFYLDLDAHYKCHMLTEPNIGYGVSEQGEALDILRAAGDVSVGAVYCLYASSIFT